MNSASLIPKFVSRFTCLKHIASHWLLELPPSMAVFIYTFTEILGVIFPLCLYASLRSRVLPHTNSIGASLVLECTWEFVILCTVGTYVLQSAFTLTSQCRGEDVSPPSLVWWCHSPSGSVVGNVQFSTRVICKKWTRRFILQRGLAAALLPISLIGMSSIPLEDVSIVGCTHSLEVVPLWQLPLGHLDLRTQWWTIIRLFAVSAKTRTDGRCRIFRRCCLAFRAYSCAYVPKFLK